MNVWVENTTGIGKCSYHLLLTSNNSWEGFFSTKNAAICWSEEMNNFQLLVSTNGIALNDGFVATYLINIADFIDSILICKFTAWAQASQPRCVIAWQTRHKQRRFTGVNVDRTIASRLTNPKEVQEKWFLNTMGPWMALHKFDCIAI